MTCLINLIVYTVTFPIAFLTNLSRYLIRRMHRKYRKLRAGDAREIALLKNKLAAVALVLLTIPVAILDGDATATVFILFIAIPMFFSSKPWFI